MSDCRKFEEILWRYQEVPESHKAELESHLAQCSKCRQALETIRALRESSKTDESVLASIDGRAFDDAVMRKIKNRSDELIMVAAITPKYAWRMAFSFALAAAVVLFLAKSVSDLNDIGGRMPGNSAGRAFMPESEKYGLINLEFAQRQSSDKARSVGPSLHAGLEKKESEYPHEGTFSILPMPVTAPAPDSINIGAVYVTNDSISFHQQSSAASLAEIYTDTGAVQAILPQSSILVTIEKMPQPLRIAIPEYPIWAKKRGLSGTVWVKARVGNDGKVTQAEILSSDIRGVGFEESALKAAKDNLFIPALSNGINLAVWIVYPVKFINKD